MTIDRLDLLIRTARARSGNQGDGSDSQGVPQRNFVAAANDAQSRIFALMMLRAPNIFTKEGFITTLSGVASYDLPTDVYLKSRLVSVQFTPNGNAQLYYPLEHRTPRQEVTIPALPDSYFLRNGKMILSPTPLTGYANAIRLNYQFIVPGLDIRRAKIATVNTGAGTLTLTTDATLTTETENDLANGWVDTITVVDSTGQIIDSGRVVSSYSSTTKLLTLTSLTGSTALAGQYVVFGTNVSTHSSLPDICQRYLTEYMTVRTQVSDTSTEAQSTNSILTAIESEILEAIDMLEEDIFAITILDRSMLNYDEDWET